MVNDITIMDHGKYVGYELKDIPDNYLLWWSAHVSPTYMNQYIHDYIKNKDRCFHEFDFENRPNQSCKKCGKSPSI